jgi:AcrR family transcriptional regulator
MAAGRPRSFNTDKALDRAMHVFWRKGYDGTSLSDLTRAMRINAPSLYAAYGNKAALFGKVIDRYAAGPGRYVPKALEAPTAREVVEQLFKGVVGLQVAKNHPGGCLLVQGAMSAGDKTSRIRKEVTARLAMCEGACEVRARLAQACEPGPPRALHHGGARRHCGRGRHGCEAQTIANHRRGCAARLAELRLGADRNSRLSQVVAADTCATFMACESASLSAPVERFRDSAAHRCARAESYGANRAKNGVPT